MTLERALATPTAGAAPLLAPPLTAPTPPTPPDPTQAILPRIPSDTAPRRLPTSTLMRRVLPPPGAAPPAQSSARAGIADDPAAVQIQTDFQAGRITKQEAKRRLAALGYE